MSFAESLISVSQSAVATRNRVDILLDKLDGTEDGDTLKAVLLNTSIRSATITQALKKEYGPGTVKDGSVAEWRRKNLAELTGL